MRLNNYFRNSALLFAAWCGMYCDYALGQKSEGNVLPQELRQALDTMVATGSGHTQAIQAFRKLPPNQAQFMAILALREPQYAQRVDTRRALLQSIASYKQELTPDGRMRLVECLNDPAQEIQQLCCNALSPLEIEREWDKLYGIAVGGNHTEPEREAAVKTLMGWGPCISHHVVEFGIVLRDTVENERIRWFAARAILNAGGLEEAIRQFNVSDSLGAKIVSGALARYLAERDAKREPWNHQDRQCRLLALDLVLKIMKNPSIDARKEALAAIVFVAGEDYMVVKSPSDYHLNPAIQRAYEEMRAGDSDPELRQQAADQLDPQRQKEVAQAIIRNRNRQSQ